MPPTPNAAQAHLRASIASLTLSTPVQAYTSSVEAVLLEATVCFLRTLGLLSVRQAHHAGRTQVNVLDLVASLAEHHPRLLQELTTFAAAETEAAAGAHPLTPPSPSAADSACAVNWFCTSSQEARPLHVPDFLPAYPSVHTYTFTPCAVPRRRESAAIRKHLGRLRRGAGAKMLQMHRPLTPSAQRHPPPTNVLPPPAVGAPLPALTAESDVVASITALPFKHAYERELSTTQGEARAMSSRQSDILQRQHVRGLEEAGNEEVVNNTDGPAA